MGAGMDEKIGFAEFESDEVRVGLNYALEKKGERLHHETLRVVGSTAGAIMQTKRCAPRVAAYQALHQYAQHNRLNFAPDRFEAYIRAIAKMMSDRSVRARAFRKKAA
jgi:hypothetical protein